MSAKPAPEATNAPAKKGGIMGMILGVFAAIMAVMMLPTTLVVVIGLVPSAVAFFVDTSRDRMLGPIVMSLNVAGVLPLVLKLWQHGHTMNAAVDILTEPFMMALVLTPSAFGWLLFNYTPQLVSGIMRRRAESRIRTLEKYQEDLVQQWSNAVSNGQAIAKPKDETTSKNSVSA